MSLGFFIPLLGLIAGAGIGYPFGRLQISAQKREENRNKKNRPSRWSLFASKGARISYLLLTLVLIQAICPFLFQAGTQWWVSGGVMLGYGSILFRHIMLRRREISA